MVRLPGGTFTLGQRRGLETVEPFCVDLTEVTVEAYTACAQAGKCTTDHVGESSADGMTFMADSACNFGVASRGNHPMNCVDWEQAATYCKIASKRLPSEEEWEWAARGGSSGTAYPWGNAAADSQPCWMGVTKRSGTCPVGSNPTGDAPSGVHDLMGNVWEWTASSHDLSTRIARGGGWSTFLTAHLGAVVRNWRPPLERVNSLGFRCVR